MSESGGAGTGLAAAVSNAIAAAKQMWEVLILPAIPIGFGVAKWIAVRRDKRDDARRTEDQRRDAAWDAKLARADQQVQAHVAWLEARATYAEARAREADARADAAERERWRMELWVRDYGNALDNARKDADDARDKAELPPGAWKDVPRPKLPGDA